MGWIHYLHEFNFASALVRLLLAAVTGTLLGMGQTRRGRSAGMRTYTLVCTGAALTVLISYYLNAGFGSFWADALTVTPLRFDASRYAAGVIAGIGFLAAGTIIGVGHQQVAGLAGAAGLFVTACLGLASGAGFYEGLISCAIVILLVMGPLRRAEKRFRRGLKNVVIYVEYTAPEDLIDIEETLRGGGVLIYDADEEREGDCPSAVLQLRLGGALHAHSEMLSVLAELPCVRSVQELVDT